MSATPPPSLADMIALADRIRPPAPAPAPAEERGIAKHAATIITALSLGLIVWTGSSITSLGTAVTRMSATVDAVQKSVTDLQAAQGAAGQQVGDLKASVAKQEARADAADADIGRVKERIRILEGQKPVNPRPERAEPF